MCGIAGYFSFGDASTDNPGLTRAIRTLAHRGPDGEGTYTDGDVGLAHSRLSIIDITGGRQPMQNADGSLCLVFNGEIFNYLELQRELETKGHRFQTRSDTEVILHLYQELGDACVEKLNGQWAFALWDRARQRLLLSRDRLGVRPLYYTIAGSRLFFGSEVKALFTWPVVERALDLEALDQIFTFWAPLPPRTIFRGICELPPGHSLAVDQRGSTLHRHWRPAYCEDLSLNGESGDQLLELLTDAVSKRLRADVPVGAYLSGGLDSTVIAALIRKVSPAPLKTFSVTFDEPEFDESSYQREAVKFLGTEHEDVRCTAADIGRVFPEVIRHTERPILRTAPAPLFLLSKLVREQGYKVVLTGEGADEMLAGYDIFKEAKIRRFCARYPESHMRPLLFRRLYPYLPGVQAQSDGYRQAFFGAKPGAELSPLSSHLARWQLTAGLKLFFSGDVREHLQGHDAMRDLEADLPAEFSQWNWLNRSQYLEAAYLLPGYILSSQGDRMAMAHSVEGRFPFLDHRVVEFSSRLPARLKMRVLQEKHLLKSCARGLVPEAVTKRTKQPYRAPEAASLVHTDYARELLAPERIRQDGIFHSEAVEKLVAKARQGRASGARDNMALVGILSTQLVMEQFIR